MSQHYYMGSDLSLSATGVTVINHQTIVFQTVIKTDPSPYVGQRIYKIAATIVEIYKTYQPEEHAIEDVSSFFKGNAMMTPQLHGAVRSELYRAGISTPYYVAPSSLKKFVTGSGRAEKSDIKMAILEKWGQKIPNNNVADAYGLARVAGAVHGGLPAIHPYEKECVATILKSPLNEARWVVAR